LLPSYRRVVNDVKDRAVAYVVGARLTGAGRTWTVVDESYRTVAPIEEWLEAHRQLWSPNTVRGYATGLAQWWTFLEQRDETAGWAKLGVPAVSGFLSWLRNDRTIEHSIARDVKTTLSAETLEARLAALFSFYRWHGSVNNVPVAGRLLRALSR
jgi:site-specific recombinase XerC